MDSQLEACIREISMNRLAKTEDYLHRKDILPMRTRIQREQNATKECVITVRRSGTIEEL